MSRPRPMFSAATGAGGARRGDGDRPGVSRTPGSLEYLPKPIQRRFGESGIDPEQAMGLEWLLTTGTGGFAMGTVPGVPTRRYHGLLVAAITPPVRRAVLLSEIVAELDVPGEGRFSLSTFRFPGGVRHPDGSRWLDAFETDGLMCRWRWRVNISGDDVTVVRELTLAEGRSAAVVRYAVVEPSRRMRLHLRPLCAMRNFHALKHELAEDAHDGVRSVSCRDRAVDVASMIDGRGVSLRLCADAGRFVAQPDWWRRFVYDRETERGQDDTEDLYSPGEFTLDIAPGDSPVLQMTASLLNDDDRPCAALPEHSTELTNFSKKVTSTAWTRRERLGGVVRRVVPAASSGVLPTDAESIARLVVAADAFVVRSFKVEREGHGDEQPVDFGERWIRPGGVSIIAGYPWFSDWGRDSMIALPGLLLSCGRYDEAFEVLRTFAGARRDGLIPNRFDDDGGESEYNTADASMWFLHASCAWLDATGDQEAFGQHLWPACEEIVRAHERGTIFGIRIDPADGLITAGSLQTQLTWMDARRDGVVFTPRHGKAVEINALWHHGLCALSRAVRPMDAAVADEMESLALRVRESFRKLFWNEEAGCLFDRLEPVERGGGGGGESVVWRACSEIRPNQLFAVSLEHSPLTDDQRASVVRVVKERLVTPVGVRTLDPADPGYRPRYSGALFERDGSYHQGTAWPWLLGPYAEAVLRVGGFREAARREAIDALRPILTTLDSHGLGSISEVYDGGDVFGKAGAALHGGSLEASARTSVSPSPLVDHAGQRADGCPAQAWSVAEVLRVMLMAHRQRA